MKILNNTPGPWHTVNTDGDFEEVYIESDVGDTLVAMIQYHSYSPDRDTIRANATLLAAAPTLHECLKDLVESFPSGEEGMAVASKMGADSHLFAARVLLDQISNEML